jgi:hypothetical protein
MIRVNLVSHRAQHPLVLDRQSALVVAYHRGVLLQMFVHGDAGSYRLEATARGCTIMGDRVRKAGEWRRPS